MNVGATPRLWLRSFHKHSVPRQADRHRRFPTEAAPQARPLVIIGLPRTGTTLLADLVDRDPANRSILRWEFDQCVPPPEAATLRTDPRITESALGLELLDAVNPGFKAIHHEEPDGPTEDVAVFGDL